MIDRPFKVLLVGVGGQGVLTCARTLGDAGLAAGLEVTIGQLHGMSQRGGGVESTVVLGPARTAFIGPGEAQVVFGFEPLETVRAVSRMSSKTCVVMNRDRITPFSMTFQDHAYPSLDSIDTRIRQAANQLIIADATAMARQAGDVRTIGAALLGMTARLDVLPFDEHTLRTAMEANCPAAALPANRRAFALGADTRLAESA